MCDIVNYQTIGFEFGKGTCFIELRSFAAVRIQWYSSPFLSWNVIALYCIGPGTSSLADPMEHKNNYLLIAGVISQQYQFVGH